MIYLHKLLPALFLPIGVTALLVVAGLLLRRRLLCLAGLAVLWLASTPVIGNAAIRAAEGWQARQPIAAAPRARAIVVLSNGRAQPPGDPAASEWGDDVDRFYGGVDLFKAGKAPLLIFTNPQLPWRPGADTEGDRLADWAAELGVPRDRILVTGGVANTDDEARAVAGALAGRAKSDEVSQVLLVTSAYHMRRARFLFARAGLDTAPFPVDFQTGEGHILTILDFLPNAGSLRNTETALREMYGLLFYQLLPGR
jgi:uncharacterized SAM-binding protein YcdF (DUF218 family)